MRRVFFLAWALGLLGLASAWADDPVSLPTPPPLRELPCRLVDEAGRPVRGATVRLCGVDRGAPSLEMDEDRIDREPGWKFTTDQEGRFTARFGCFRPDGPEEHAGPGYGHFYLVVGRVGYAGAVSREVLNLDDAEWDRWQADRDASWRFLREHGEWERGEFAPWLLGQSPPAPSTGGELSVVLRRGLAVRGRIVDPAGRPLRGRNVGLSFDLHYDSHTGAGGRFFEQTATTDRAGWFEFRHVYPNVFTLDAGNTAAGEPPFWIRTRVRDRWFDRIEDQITPRRGDLRDPADYEGALALRLVMSRRPVYHYFGRVLDGSARPLAGAVVEVRCVLHWPVRDWFEDHGSGQPTRTDAAGRYSFWSPTRFVDRISLRAPGYSGGLDAPGDACLAPGRHDFAALVRSPGE